MKFTEFAINVSKYFITKLHIYNIIFYTLYYSDTLYNTVG